jgi:hypothetical protein
MADLVQVRKKAQITLPQSVRKRLGIEEGDGLLQAEHIPGFQGQKRSRVRLARIRKPK